MDTNECKVGSVLYSDVKSGWKILTTKDVREPQYRRPKLFSSMCSSPFVASALRAVTAGGNGTGTAATAMGQRHVTVWGRRGGCWGHKSRDSDSTRTRLRTSKHGGGL